MRRLAWWVVPTVLFLFPFTLLPFAPASSAPNLCRHISGPFHRYHNAIYNSHRQRFIPYGLTISGLGNPHWPGHVGGDVSAIRQISANWCGNSVRLQAFQDGGVDKKTLKLNPKFWSDLQQEVNAAVVNGLIPIINLQSEGNGSVWREFMPTKQSRVWWKEAIHLFGSDPSVVFDIWNEPRRIKWRTSNQLWNRWRDGGCWWGGCWMGMEQLARYVHGLSPSHLLIVEGPQTAGTLAGAPWHQITKAGPVLYSVNHGGPTLAAHTNAYWDAKFGRASRYIPITDTEWTNYANGYGRMCWPDAIRSVPRFLDYIADHHMGLEAWTYAAGVLVTSTTSGFPTRIKANWSCRNGLDQGAGHQIDSFFHQYN